MIQKQKKYSLWIRPAQSQIDELTKIISKLAHKNFTTPFPPHITLMSQITTDLVCITQIGKIIAEQNDTFELELNHVDYTEEYFRNLYVQVSLNPILDKLHKECLKLSKKSNIEEYFPHISLLYGNLCEHKQIELQLKLANRIPRTILL